MSTIALAFAGLVDHYVAMNNFKSDKKQLSKAADLCLQLYRASFLLTPKDKALKTTIYNMFSSLLTEICQIYEEEDPKDPFFGEENIATSMNNIAKGKDSDKERKKTEKDIKEIEKVKDTKKEDKETEKEVKEDEKERKTNEQIIDTKKEVKDTELAKDIKKNTKETPRRTELAKDTKKEVKETELAKDTKKEVKETEKERKTHQTKDTKKDIRPPTIYNVALLLKCILDKVKPNIDTEIYEEFIDTVLLELVYYLISFFKTYLAFDISTAPISDDFSYIKPENAIHFLFSLSIHRSPDRFLKYDSYNTLSSDIYKILRSASNKVMNSRNYKQTMKEFEEVKKKIAELSQSSDKKFNDQDQKFNVHDQKFNDQDQKFNDYDQKLLEMKKLIEEQAKQLKQYKLNEEVTNKSLSEEKSEHANEILALQKQIENLTLANKELQNDLESTKENRDKINTDFQNLNHRLLKRDSEYNQLKKDMKDLEAAKNKKIKEQASLIQAEKARVKEYQEKMGKHYSNSTTFNGIDDFNNKFEFIYSYVLEKRAEDYSLDFNEIKDN